MSSPASGSAGAVEHAGERAIIERIRSRIPSAPASLLVGIGDDAAVAVPRRGALQVLTTDALVEREHFDWRFSAPADVGYKALAVNISDIAAMGAAPELALLSLMLPPGTPLRIIDELIDGFLELARAERVTLAGGNIARTSGPFVVDVTVLGSVRPRKILRRNGAKAGDELYVTGSLGAAAAGLGWLRAHAPQSVSAAVEYPAHHEARAALAPEDPDLAECVERHRRPQPRMRVGALLGRLKAATACMDLSDGLADAASQICEASGVGATLDAAALPLARGAIRWFESQGRDAVDAAMSGGDDYELMFAVSPKRRGRLRAVVRESRGVPLTRIGVLTPGRSLLIKRGDRHDPLPPGFEHFR